MKALYLAGSRCIRSSPYFLRLPLYKVCFIFSEILLLSLLALQYGIVLLLFFITDGKRVAALHPMSTLAKPWVPHIGLGSLPPIFLLLGPHFSSAVEASMKIAVERRLLSIPGQPWQNRGFPILGWGAGSHIPSVGSPYATAWCWKIALQWKEVSFPSRVNPGGLGASPSSVGVPGPILSSILPTSFSSQPTAQYKVAALDYSSSV